MGHPSFLSPNELDPLSAGQGGTSIRTGTSHGQEGHSIEKGSYGFGSTHQQATSNQATRERDTILNRNSYET